MWSLTCFVRAQVKAFLAKIDEVSRALGKTKKDNAEEKRQIQKAHDEALDGRSCPSKLRLCLCL